MDNNYLIASLTNLITKLNPGLTVLSVNNKGETLKIIISGNGDYLSFANNRNLIEEKIRTLLPKTKFKIIFHERSKNFENNKNDKMPEKIKFTNIKQLIVIASCKGGVGKSTITSLIARNYLQQGKKVGILDADIYGPSIPTIFSCEEKAEIKNNKFIPHLINDIKIMSMGNIVPQDKAAIWRGPMVSKALYQLLLSTDWGDLDYLFIDTPPGTGDIFLSLLEKYSIDGVVLVTTPHLLSINELVKSIDLFNKLKVPILGVVENMSYIENLKNGEKNYIFGQSKLNELIDKHYIRLLAKLPIIKFDNIFDKTLPLVEIF